MAPGDDSPATLREIDLRFAALTEKLDTFETHLAEQRRADQAALQLQAAEYERRLTALNHAHEQALAVQHTYVTQDKYEDKLKAEEQARQAALLRINERFEDYITRADARVREVENAMATQAVAAEVQSRAAEDAARKAKDAAEEAGRKSNRNIAIVGVVLTLIIAVAQFWGTQETGQQIDDTPPTTTAD